MDTNKTVFEMLLGQLSGYSKLIATLAVVFVFVSFMAGNALALTPDTWSLPSYLPEACGAAAACIVKFIP